jgi:soluble lytic murein transglycosylase-like protein
MIGRQKKTILASLLLLAVFLPTMTGATMYAYLDAKGDRHYKDVKEALTKGRTKIIARKLNNSSSRTISAQGYDILREDPQALDGYIQIAALNHQVDPLLIMAVIKAESNFDSNAVSAKGAQGLMQLMPGTAKNLRVANPFDPSQNINGGTKYLRRLLDSYNGDIRLSLAAFNAGPGNVTPSGMKVYIPETQEYVARVMGHYSSYRSGMASLSNITINKR